MNVILHVLRTNTPIYSLIERLCIERHFCTLFVIGKWDWFSVFPQRYSVPYSLKRSELCYIFNADHCLNGLVCLGFSFVSTSLKT